MFEQVTCKDRDQAFWQQADGGSQQVGSWADFAQGETEVNDVGGNNVNTTAEHHSPQPVLPDPFVDAPEQFFLPISFLEIAGKENPHHVKGEHNRNQVHSPGYKYGRSKADDESHGQIDVENGQARKGA